MGAARPGAAAEQPAHRLRLPVHLLKVFIVEDSPMIRDSLIAALHPPSA